MPDRETTALEDAANTSNARAMTVADVREVINALYRVLFDEAEKAKLPFSRPVPKYMATCLGNTISDLDRITKPGADTLPESECEITSAGRRLRSIILEWDNWIYAWEHALVAVLNRCSNVLDGASVSSVNGLRPALETARSILRGL